MPEKEIKEKCGWCGKKAVLADGYYCPKCMSEKEIREQIIEKLREIISASENRDWDREVY